MGNETEFEEVEVFVDEDGNEYSADDLEDLEDDSEPDLDDLINEIDDNDQDAQDNQGDPDDFSDLLDDFDEEVEEEVDSGEDDEQEEEEEEETLLDLTGEDGESASDNASPDQILMAMEDVASWKSLIDVVKEAGEDPEVLTTLYKQGYTAKFLSSHGITNLQSFQEVIEGLEAKVNPNAIYVPDAETEPELLEDFKEEILGIPKERDGYSSDVFDASPLADDTEAQEILIDRAYTLGLSEDQYVATVKYAIEAEEVRLQAEERQAREYKADQKDQVNKLFGEYKPSVLNRVSRTLRQHPEFVKEMKESGILDNAQFINLIHKLSITGSGSLKDIDPTETKVTINTNTPKLGKYSRRQLLDMKAKVSKSPYLQKEYLYSDKESDRLKYKKNQEVLNKINGQLRKF